MFTKLNMTSYRQSYCLDLCLQEYTKAKCPCLDASLPNIYDDALICNNLKSIDCVIKAKIDFIKDSSANTCPKCPLECSSIEYNQRYTRSRYPTIYYTNYLRFQTNLVKRFPNTTNVSDNHIQKNIVLLNVFYDTLATTYVDEMPEVTSDSLFGNIGGNLGLFCVRS
jgi:hypothetical protein